MFKPKPPVEKTGLEKARDDSLIELNSFHADQDEYAKVMAHVKTLTELIQLEKPEKLSPNTLATVLGNAFIAVLVVGYESKNVVTTKVIPFLNKAK
jgi:hypothetical protein